MAVTIVTREVGGTAKGSPLTNAELDNNFINLNTGKQDSNSNLAALAGLTGVADRLPYFTGAGALSLAVLSAFSRTLLDDADAPSWRTTLGLTAAATTALSANTQDRTAGYVLRYGDLGIGIPVVLSIPDLNNYTDDGNFYCGGASPPLNGPVSQYGWLRVKGYTNANFCTQTFETLDGATYYRQKVSGTWRGWETYIRAVGGTTQIWGNLAVGNGAFNEAAPVTLASAATVLIGAAASNTVFITGTTTITSFGTAANGIRRCLRFTGAMQITAGAGLKLPGGNSITTVNGDFAEFVSFGGGNWECVTYTKNAGMPLAINDINNTLTSTSTTQPLSAAQGKVLADQIAANNLTIRVFEFIATEGQTTFTGADSNAQTLAYTPGVNTSVEVNGVRIQRAVDYTATNGTSVVLAVGADVGDVVTIEALGSFTVANAYTKTEADAALASSVALAAEPLFAVTWWGGTRANIASGRLPLDGQIVNRSAYPDIWAGVVAGIYPSVTEASWQATAANRGSFSTGDGSTTFRMPDLNGKQAGSISAPFLRGDGTNSGGSPGIIQVNQNLAHAHNISTDINGASTTLAATLGTAANNAMRLQYLGNDSQGNYALYASTVGSGGTEARPNAAVGCWVMRMFGAISSVGLADVASMAQAYATFITQCLRKDADTGWVTPTLTNSWANYAGFQGARYKRYPDGTVEIQGLIQSGTIAAAAFTIPVGFRPAANLIFPSATSTGYGTLYVYATGAITPSIGGTAWFSINCRYMGEA